MDKPPAINLILGLYVCFTFAFSVALSEPPAITDVTLTCHNLKNVLYWNYSAPELKPEFNITIRGYSSKGSSVRTSQTYLDISEYTQNAEDSYEVEVAAQAKESDNQTASSKSIQFSYSEDLNTDIKCVVDFPKLDVSVFDRRVNLSFLHPYYFYNHESLNGDFYFHIFYNGTRREYVCYKEDDVCTEEFLLSESLYGKCIILNIKGSVEGIPAKITRQVCEHKAPDNTDWVMLSTVLSCVGLGLLLLIICGVIMFKKLTRADSQGTLSKLLKIVRSDHVNVPEQPTLSKLTSVGHTPLLETPDPMLAEVTFTKFEDSSDLPTHIPINPEGTYSEEQEQEDGDADVDSSNSFSGYDCHKFPIDMGQGDIVEAYGPR